MGFFKKLVKGVTKVVGGAVSFAANVVGQTGILPGSKLISSIGGMAGKLISGSSGSTGSAAPVKVQQAAQASSFQSLQTGATQQAGTNAQLVFGQKTDSAISDFFKQEKPWYVWLGLGLGGLLVPIIIFKLFFSRKRR